MKRAKNVLIAETQRRFLVTLVIGGIVAGVVDHLSPEYPLCFPESMHESLSQPQLGRLRIIRFYSAGVDNISYICYISIMKMQTQLTTNFFYFWFSPSRKGVSLSFLK